jgi:2-dehydropantoate 2-reductase
LPSTSSHAAPKGSRSRVPVDTFTQVIPAVTAEGIEGVFRGVVLAVKAQHTQESLEALAPHLADDGYVLSAQNGLNELVIAKRLGAERTMGCFVNFGADWLGPGKILYGNRGAVVVGEIDRAIRERTREMHGLLKLFEPDAVLTDDIWGYLWGKLAYGAMLFATALTPDSIADNFADPARTPAWLALGREVMAVARARGVKPRGFNGFEPAAFAPGAAETVAVDSIRAMEAFNRPNAKTHTGVWRDLAVRKRKTEVDPQIGAIGALAREEGIPTPAIDALVRLIHDVEDGRRPQSIDEYIEKNIEAIEDYIVRSLQFTCRISARVVLFNSLHHVPYDTGELFDTGKAVDVSERPDFPQWEVSYDTSYAAAGHEIFREYVQGKGKYPQFFKKAKFLEDAAKDQADKFPEDVAETVRAAVSGSAPPTVSNDPEITGPLGGGLGSGIGKPKLVKRAK